MADYVLQIPIKESEVENLKKGFLAAEPMDEDQQEEYTELEWVIERIKVFINNKAVKGLKKLRDKNDPVTTDFFVEE